MPQLDQPRDQEHAGSPENLTSGLGISAKVVELAVMLGEDDAFVVDDSWPKRESTDSPRPHGALLALADREREMIEATLAESLSA